MIVDKILAAFPGGHQDNDGARIPCPVHHGESSNVHVWPDSKTPDRWFVHCHSRECAAAEVAKAIERTAGVDLGRSARGRRNGRDYIQAVYYTADGRRTASYRKDWPKDWNGKPCNYQGCKDGKPHKHIWQDRGTPAKGLLLLAWHPQAESDPDVAVIPEGEKAAKAIKAAGWTAYTYCGGSKRAKHADYSPVGGKTVVVWPDADKPGREAGDWAAQKALEAGADSVQKVQLAADLETGADAADLLPGEIVAVIERALAEAPEEQPHDAALGVEDAPPISAHTVRVIKNTAAGLETVLDYLQMEVRQNARNLRAEVRRRDWPSAKAQEWTQQWGFPPQPGGWIQFSDGIDAAINDVSMELFNFLSERGGLKTAEWAQNRFGQAMVNNYQDHQADPFRDWLEMLPAWDGKQRLDQLWIATLLMPDDELTREGGRRFLIGAVRRAYEPGCVHDWMPVLVGPQGLGKSSVLQELVAPSREWFSDSTMLSGTPKEKQESTGPAVIVEFSEMAGLDRADAAAFKQWLVKRADQLRPAYGHHSERTERRFVCVGTANEDPAGIVPYDPTGARRYAVLVSTYSGPLDDLQEYARRGRSWVQENLGQLWAEALAEYREAKQNGADDMNLLPGHLRKAQEDAAFWASAPARRHVI